MKDQGKKQIKIITEHGKQLTKSNEFVEQINLPPEKVKIIFDNLVAKRMEEMEKYLIILLQKEWRKWKNYRRV